MATMDRFADFAQRKLMLDLAAEYGLDQDTVRRVLIGIALGKRVEMHDKLRKAAGR